ncbi:MAG: electron transport complex subunit RsxC [Clostridiales bacterium]|nr:electron transport complex subunit RsxC [Clostridiales bacterium]
MFKSFLDPLSGVHVPHRKNTAHLEAVRMPPPGSVVIPTVMHIGAPAKPIVKAGDKVAVGQLIAESGGFVSAPVHASVSGTVKKVEDIVLSNGRQAPAIYIESDGEMRPYEGIHKPEISSLADLAEAVRDSGIVGLGGAGFPTSVKLAIKDISKVEYFVINGAECEPYITSDTRTMLDYSKMLERGVRRIVELTKPKAVYLGIEKNKPKAIKKLKQIFRDDPTIVVKGLPPMYPQGGEKVLIYNTTGRIVPEGKLPLDVGVVIMNVTTLANIEQYLETGMPLVEKLITVDGSAVKEPKNIFAPIGTRLSDVFEFCGGFKEEPKKILYGGPMMGTAVPDLSVPVLKNTNAVLAFAEKDAEVPKETPCIRCGNCVNHCPMRLNPPAIAKAFNNKDAEGLYKQRVNLCMECGACSFICPAHQPIVQRHKLAKILVRDWQNAQKGGKA